jgi:integrase
MSNRDRRVRRIGARWGFVVDVASPSGKRRQIRRQGFPTSTAANMELHRVLEDAGHGVVVTRGGVTVGDYLTQRWVPSLDGRRIRETTRYAYTRSVHNHLVPHLGGPRLTALDAAAIETMLGALARQGLSPKTRHNVLGVLSKALTDARRWRLIRANPTSEVERPATERRAARAWSTEQLAKFLRATTGSRLEPGWRFVLLTGCRRGELCGLRWSDLDLDRGTVTITNQRTTAGGRIVEGPPKTAAGSRTVALDAVTVGMLVEWRRAQRVELLRLGVRSPAGYVFTRPNGSPLVPDDVTAAFAALCNEIGLPGIGVHGLRHSSATFLLAAGVSPKVVSQRLGHASVALTLGLYSHVLPGHDEAAVEAFAASLRAQTEAPCDTSVTAQRSDCALSP